MIREQSRASNNKIVQHILESEDKINTNISSHNRNISAKMEEIQLNIARKDEILYERVHSNEVKFNEEVHKQKKAVMSLIEKEKEFLQINHAELITHLHQTELNIHSKTEETTEGILAGVEQTKREITDKIDDLSGNLKETVTVGASKLRKQGNIDILKFS